MGEENVKKKEEKKKKRKTTTEGGSVGSRATWAPPRRPRGAIPSNLHVGTEKTKGKTREKKARRFCRKIAQ